MRFCPKHASVSLSSTVFPVSPFGLDRRERLLEAREESPKGKETANTVYYGKLGA